MSCSVSSGDKSRESKVCFILLFRVSVIVARTFTSPRGKTGRFYQIVRTSEAPKEVLVEETFSRG